MKSKTTDLMTISEKKEIVATIAANIRKEMERQEISGRALAVKARLLPMTVNDCINGRKLPSVVLVFAIARVLGTSIEKLAEEPARTKPRRAKQTA